MRTVEEKQARPSRLRAAAAALSVPALLFLIITCFYWKLTLSNQYTWMETPDIANQVLPWFQFQAGEWHSGHFPLWDPYEWGGQSLIGQAQPGVTYPFNWILFLWPLRNGWIRQAAMHWYFVLIHYMGALFCYWLCRDLKRSRGASLFAGLAFGLAGWIGHTDWPQMLNGAIWAPLVFLFLLRALRGERPLANAGISGALMGFSLLSGHHQIPTFVGLAVGGVWIYGFFRKGRLDRRLLYPAAAFAVLLLLTSAFQVLPAYEYGKLSLRWVSAQNPVGWKDRVPYYVHDNFGLQPLSVLGSFIPGIYRHSDPFVGLAILSLAFVAVAGEWRDRTVRLFAFIAIAAVVFSLSSYSVFHGFLYMVVPMVEKARNPSMAIFIFHFGIAVLSAYGIDGYLSSSEIWARRLTRALVAIGITLYLLLFGFLLAQFQKGLDPQQVALVALSSLFLAAVFYGWKREQLSSRGALALLTLIMLFETGISTGFYWGHRDQVNSLLKNLPQGAEIAKFARAQPNPVRLEMDDQFFPYNFGDFYGIDVFGGYLASLTSRISQVQPDYHARMLFGTNYYVGAKPIRENQVEVASSGDLKVYANPEAFPRAWSVHEATSIGGEPDIGPSLQKPLDELRRQTFVFGLPPKLETCASPDDVRLVNRQTDRVIIEADMKCRGMVVAGEAFYPGWVASVDGSPARIYEAYGVLRGVVAGAGRHRIEMRYRPESVYWGAGLTAAGLLAALVLGISGKFTHRGVRHLTEL